MNPKIVQFLSALRLAAEASGIQGGSWASMESADIVRALSQRYVGVSHRNGHRERLLAMGHVRTHATLRAFFATGQWPEVAPLERLQNPIGVLAVLHYKLRPEAEALFGTENLPPIFGRTREFLRKLGDFSAKCAAGEANAHQRIELSLLEVQRELQQLTEEPAREECCA